MSSLYRVDSIKSMGKRAVSSDLTRKLSTRRILSKFRRDKSKPKSRSSNDNDNSEGSSGSPDKTLNNYSVLSDDVQSTTPDIEGYAATDKPVDKDTIDKNINNPIPHAAELEKVVNPEETIKVKQQEELANDVSNNIPINPENQERQEESAPLLPRNTNDIKDAETSIDAHSIEPILQSTQDNSRGQAKHTTLSHPAYPVIDDTILLLRSPQSYGAINIVDIPESSSLVGNHIHVDEGNSLLPKPVTAPNIIGNHSRKWPTRGKWMASILIIVIAGLLIWQYIVHQTLLLITSVSNFQVDNVRLQRIDNSGVCIAANGSLNFDFEDLHGWRRWYGQIFSSTVREVSVIEAEKVGVAIELVIIDDINAINENTFKVAEFQLTKPIALDFLADSPMNITNQYIEIKETDMAGLLSALGDIYSGNNYKVDNLKMLVSLDVQQCDVESTILGLKIRKKISTSLSPLLELDLEESKRFFDIKKSDIIGKTFPFTIIDNDLLSVVVDEFSITSTSVPQVEILANIESSVDFKKDIVDYNVGLNEILWSVKMQNCQGKLVDLMAVNVGKLEVEKVSMHKRIHSLQIQVQIPEISNSLLEDCGDHYSILNSLLINVLKDYDPLDESMLFISASHSNNPAWLNYVLSNVEIPISINFLKRFFTNSNNFMAAKGDFISNYLLDFELSKSELYLPKQVSENDINPVLTSLESTIQFRIPDFIDSTHNIIEFQVDSFSGDLEICHCDSEKEIDILEVEFINNQSLNIEFDYLVNKSVTMNLHLTDNEIVIVNSSDLNLILVNDLSTISDGESEILLFNFAPLVSLNISKFALLNGGDEFQFKDIPFSVNYNLNTSDLIPTVVRNHNVTSLVDYMIQNLIIHITDIVYISSTSDSLVVAVNLKIFTPDDLYDDPSKQYSLITDYISEKLIDLHFGYNGTKLGHAIMKEMDFNSSRLYSNVSILVDLNPSSFDGEDGLGKIMVRELLSNFISNEFPKIEIFGHSESFPSSKKISEVLEGVNISFQLPEYNCPVSPTNKHEYLLSTLKEDDNRGESTGLSLTNDIWEHFGDPGTFGKSSPGGFIISVTMHIMTSEIEFEVHNPIVNSFVDVLIYSGKAIYHDANEDGTPIEIELAHIKTNTILRIPPGVYRTPRLPITYESKGVAGDILRKAINGKLDIESRAEFQLKIGDYDIDMDYSGDGTVAQIRL
ncbi:hypothetical protein DASC09_026120 [Saccharomycopsis crataegensis]|uniref:Tag1-like fifth Ig-like domain-containing protein n=1 Tax=Saccharomycopsis crataegensis TaxID=43959 RepID=A0AAV5QL61_9ASCO|nr:hypothetical protein DASC09_026120 [Saccharomycopsis crataegensis]